MFQYGNNVKIKIGSVRGGLGADNPILVSWFILGFFVVFIPIGREYDLFYVSILTWFLEFLVVYLSVDHKKIQFIRPWMFFVLSVGLVFLYYSEALWLKEAIRNKYGNIGDKSYFIPLFGWHFLAFIITVVKVHFNKTSKKTKDKNSAF